MAMTDLNYCFVSKAKNHCKKNPWNLYECQGQGEAENKQLRMGKDIFPPESLKNDANESVPIYDAIVGLLRKVKIKSMYP